MIIAIWHWLQEVLGLNFGLPGHSLRWYNFHSGSGSIIIPPILTVLGAYIVWRYHNQCHADNRPNGGKNCHRHGKYPFQHFKLCAKHHPNVPKKLTHLHIVKLHKSATLKK